MKNTNQLTKEEIEITEDEMKDIMNEMDRNEIKNLKDLETFLIKSVELISTNRNCFKRSLISF